ncbi:MAG: hypothetical protein MUO27_10020 [Sedimentisphaerales bacterium]|nr:hypothetical protein [Sedimentisphaerales bacterium]
MANAIARLVSVALIVERSQRRNLPTIDPSRQGVEPRQDETRASTELSRMSSVNDIRYT